MINAVIERNKKGNVIGVKVTGHADFDDYGKDIVCAAVSAITQTALIGAEKLTKAKISSSINDGDLELKIIESSEEDREKLNAILDTMVLGLCDIAKQYKDYVKVVDWGCGK